MFYKQLVGHAEPIFWRKLGHGAECGCCASIPTQLNCPGISVVKRLHYVETELVRTECEMLIFRDNPSHLSGMGWGCLCGLCNAVGSLVHAGCPGPAPHSSMDLLHRTNALTCLSFRAARGSLGLGLLPHGWLEQGCSAMGLGAGNVGAC